MSSTAVKANPKTAAELEATIAHVNNTIQWGSQNIPEGEDRRERIESLKGFVYALECRLANTLGLWANLN